MNESLTPEVRYVYGELVTGIDAGVGALVEVLSSKGLLENTIIIFSSDNGGSLESGASNGELRGGKGTAFEGGVRVPGLIWWKGEVEGSRIIEQPIVSHDWLPTLLEAAGADPAQVAKLMVRVCGRQSLTM